MLTIDLRRQFKNFLAFVSCVGLSLAFPDVGAAENFPRLEGQAPIEIQNDWNHDSEDRDNEHNQLFTKMEPEATLHLVPGLSLFAHTVIEPVRDPGPRENRAFEDEGAFVEDLFLRYETNRFAFQGGKFTPKFGLTWDIAPGIYGTDFAEAGYEFSERIGVLGSANFADVKLGSHTLSAHTFFLDTSVLSQSVGRGRGTTDKVDGGVSNTEDFTSYAFTLEGENVFAIDGLGYHLAYIRQAPGNRDQSDEKGFAVAATHNIDLGDDFSLSPLFEYVHFDDADGVGEQDRDFLVLAGRLNWNSWNLSVAYTGRDTKATGSEEIDDFQFQTSVGYQFAFGLEFNVGWHIDNENGLETRRIGALLAYTVPF